MNNHLNNRNTTLIKKSRHKAWLVVMAGFMTYFMIYGSAYNCFGLFLVPMADSFDVSRTVISSLFTIEFLSAIPASLIFGKIVNKKDLKWPMAICGALVGVGYMIFSSVNSVGMLYFGAVLVGFGLAGTVQIPAAIFIDGWFIKRKGLAMGLTMVGSGIGGTVLSQIISRVIQSSGWETAYFGLGMVIILITVPLTLIFINKSPHLKGLLRYGEEDKEFIAKLEEKQLAKDAAQDKTITLISILKKPEYWILFLGVLCFVLPMGAVKTHVVAYMGDIGYSPAISTLCLTTMTFFVIPGKPCTGWFFDKLGSRIATLICGIGMAGGLYLSLGASAGVAFAFAFAITYGFGSAMASVGIPLILKDTVNSGTNFAMTLSIINIGFNIASASGPTLMAMIQASTGSYILALSLAATVVAAGYLLCIAAVTIGKKKNKKNIK